MLKQELFIKQQQKLSPMQYQVIKMLEYPAVDMEELITREMEENPALEEGKDESETDFSEDEQSEDEDFSENEEEKDTLPDDLDIMEQEFSDNSFDYISQKYSAADENSVSAENFYSSEQTFSEFMLTQLALVEQPKEILQYAQYLIGNINNDGYLTRDIENMIDDLAFQAGIEVSEEEMQTALDIVQSLDPAGTGARSLQECLLLQLKRKPQIPSVRIAQLIIKEYFEQFSKQHYTPIMRRLMITDEEFRAAKEEILALNPKPGNAFSTRSETALARIIPDFIVEQENGNLYISLNNSNIPQLRVSSIYQKMLNDFSQKNDKKTRQAADFTKQKVDSARWFIEAIKQRNLTLLKTMIAIAKKQRAFFLTGDESLLKPMKLKDIADIVNYDASTISRVSNSKYVQTQYGIFSLKFFFSEAMPTESGEIVSNKKIQQTIKHIIDNEDKNAPITDDILTAMLQGKGYVIARRTVAKYREQMNIPSTHKRIKN
ncbi:MAG: RNA polymerase factor sigma-54 [Prevotellaceae bacterium]|jgi:RNA polymerase sigma-54 factor|nr:RNA polymerase factor sigma-54 [Prevotellaceae bacterium]